MGMGSPLRTKPGSTVPPQGGKGGVQQPIQPAVPPQGGKGGVQQPIQPAVPPQGGKGGVQQPGQPPYRPIGYPPVQPQVPAQGGKGGVQQPVQPTVPAQGGKGNMPLPSHYQSPYANYGFDSGLQSYLDQQNYRSATDAGTSFQYDPATQTFTGGTMAGRYNPIPLSVMQQVAGGNRDVLNPYFQSNFPQQPGQVPAQVLPTPQVLPPQGGFPQRDLGYGIPPPRPQVIPQPQVMPRPAPVTPARPAPMQPQGLAQLQAMLAGKR